jgi:hypothetical protein
MFGNGSWNSCYLFSLLNFLTCANSFTLEMGDRVDDLICSEMALIAD